MKKNDIILLVSVLVVALAVFLIIRMIPSTGDTVVVEVDGATVAELPLSKDTEYLIQGYNCGTNLLIIKDGKARISEASCPDKVCIHMGYADELNVLTCLPNKVIVYIRSSGN